MKKEHIIIGLITVVVLASIVMISYKQDNTPGKLDTFAMCLEDKGSIFYGAFWCPNCQNQKKMFGRSAKLLPYVECSTPNGKGQLSVCTEKNITGYPTWEFADGSREVGEVPLETLAEKTGCELPSE